MTFSLLPGQRSARPRPLGRADFRAAVEFCAQRGADGVMAGARIRQALRAVVPFGEVWVVERRRGRGAGGRLEASQIESLAWAGGNIIPVGADDLAARAFAQMAQAQGRRCASIVGQAGAVAVIWDSLRQAWPPPRSIRPTQPCLALTGQPLVAADPLVEVATMDMLEALVPACRAMFTEELGFEPPGSAQDYRAHVAAQTGKGNILVRLSPGRDRVVFKAELGSVCGPWVQVQGVWTDPAWRGRGIAKAGMAAVVRQARSRALPNVCLYVNHFNAPALAVYQAVGFRQVSTWATVMF